MASTYTTNLGIEKIGTGEQSGTWGETTNLNFDILDQAINGLVSVTLTTTGSGSPNTLPITDGTLSDGRNAFIEFVDGGDLGATAYVQLTPNDAEKIAYVRNSLSGGQSVILFQGTYNASNDFELANGKDALLYFNGGGTGAVVAVVQANEVRSGSFQIDNIVLDGNTIDVDGDLDVDVSDGDILFKDDGTTFGGLSIGGTDTDNLVIKSGSTPTAALTLHEGNVGFGTQDEASYLIDAQSASAGIQARFISTEAGATSGPDLKFYRNSASPADSDIISTFYFNANTDDGAGGVSLSDVNYGSIVFNAVETNETLGEAAGFALNLKRGGTTQQYISIVGGTTGDTDNDSIVFSTGGTAAITIDNSQNVGIGVTPSTALDVSGVGGISAEGSDSFTVNKVVEAGQASMYGDANNTHFSHNVYYDSGWKSSSNAVHGQLIFDSSGNFKIRHEGASASGTAITWDDLVTVTSSGNVGIGTGSSPSSVLTTVTSSNANNIQIRRDSTTTNDYAQIGFSVSTGTTADNNAEIRAIRTNSPNAGDTEIAFLNRGSGTGPTEAMRIDTSQRVLVGPTDSRLAGTSITPKLQVEGADAANSAIQLTRNSDSISAPNFYFLKSAGTSTGSNVLVSDNEQLGALTFQGCDGDGVPALSSIIRAEVDGTPGSDDMPGRLVFMTSADGSGSPTERMRISQNGYVGIGTGGNDPEAPLFVVGDLNYVNGINANGTITISSDDTGDNGFDGAPSIVFEAPYDAGGLSTIRVPYAIIEGRKETTSSGDTKGFLAFSTNKVSTGGTTEAMRIDSSQRVLIGQNSSFGVDGGLQIATKSGQYDGVPIQVSRFDSSNDTDGPFIYFLRSNSETIGVNTAVTDDDGLGGMLFRGADGTGYITAGYIECTVDGTPGTNDMPGRLQFYTTSDGASSGTERMRIDSSGDIKAATGGGWTGTVAQSSFSSVFERGSNANGYFIKYADGTVLMWRSGDVQYANSARLTTTFSLPVTLSTTTGALAQAVINNSTALEAIGYGNAGPEVAYVTSTTQIQVRLYVSDGNAWNVADNVDFSIFVSGYWY